MRRRIVVGIVVSLALALLGVSGCSSSSSSATSTVVSAPPAVSSTTPTSGAASAAITSTVTASFSQAMNASTVNSSSMMLTGPGGAAVAGAVTYSSVGSLATFTPAASLAYSTAYTATITIGATSSAGYALGSNYTWNFTTAASTSVAGQGTDTVDFGTSQQTIRGFGGSTAFMPSMTVAQASALFGNASSQQLGLSMLRVRIDPGGSSNWGTELGNAQEAQALGVSVMATPWTPPASMKSNNSTIAGTLNTGSYAAYAAYLESFVTYMANGGVNLYGISMQNEPDANVTYESCSWTGSTMDSWIANNASVLTTKLIMPESQNFITGYSDPALNDTQALGHIAIVAGHIYGVSPSYYTNAETLGKDVWMTEHYLLPSGAQPGISDALAAAKEIHDSMTVASYNAYFWWWVADWNAGTGVTNYGLVDTNNNPTFYGYALGQYAKFVRPGYVRTNATYNPNANIYVSAYKGGGHYVIVALNLGSSSVSQPFAIQNQTLTSLTPYTTTAAGGLAQQTAVSVSNNTFTYTLPAMSITTFVQ